MRVRLAQWIRYAWPGGSGWPASESWTEMSLADAMDALGLDGPDAEVAWDRDCHDVTLVDGIVPVLFGPIVGIAHISSFPPRLWHGGGRVRGGDGRWSSGATWDGYFRWMDAGDGTMRWDFGQVKRHRFTILSVIT